MDEKFKEMIEQYISENLTVEVSVDMDYGWSGERVKVKLMLDGRCISSDEAGLPRD